LCEISPICFRQANSCEPLSFVNVLKRSSLASIPNRPNRRLDLIDQLIRSPAFAVQLRSFAESNLSEPLIRLIVSLVTQNAFVVSASDDSLFCSETKSLVDFSSGAGPAWAEFRRSIFSEHLIHRSSVCSETADSAWLRPQVPPDESYFPLAGKPLIRLP